MNVLTVTLHPAVDRCIEVARLLPNESVSCKVLRIYGSGKGVNAARVLHRLGISATVTGFQGGATGEFSKEYLREEGITPSFVYCEEPTRTTTVIYESKSGDHYPIYETRQSVSQVEVSELIDHFSANIGESDLCLLCGAGEGPYLEAVYERMIEIAAEKHVRCLLDSSGVSLVNGIRAKPYFVKINRGELSALVNQDVVSPNQQVDALREIIRAGARFAAVSNKEKGLLATDGNQIWQGLLDVRSVHNTVGCGDSMSAGIALAILRGLSLDEIVRWGVACGTTNTQNIGAGFVQVDVLNEFLPRVEVQALRVQ